MTGRRGEVGGGREVVGRRGENFGVKKRWKKKKKKSGQGGWDFRSSGKRPQWAHPQLVHWWLLIHSSQKGVQKGK
jgi:hypothetical protein